jgi:hypothetical protein
MLSSIVIDFYKSLMFFNSHYGHKSVSLTKKRGVYPLSSSFILGSKNNCAIIDPTQTLKAFIKSLYILQAFSKRFNTLNLTKIKKTEREERFVSKEDKLSKRQEKGNGENQKISRKIFPCEARPPLPPFRGVRGVKGGQKDTGLKSLISNQRKENKILQELEFIPSFLTSLALNPLLSRDFLPPTFPKSPTGGRKKKRQIIQTQLLAPFGLMPSLPPLPPFRGVRGVLLRTKKISTAKQNLAPFIHISIKGGSVEGGWVRNRRFVKSPLYIYIKRNFVFFDFLL